MGLWREAVSRALREAAKDVSADMPGRVVMHLMTQAIIAAGIFVLVRNVAPDAFWTRVMTTIAPFCAYPVAFAFRFATAPSRLWTEAGSRLRELERRDIAARVAVETADRGTNPSVRNVALWVTNSGDDILRDCIIKIERATDTDTGVDLLSRGPRYAPPDGQIEGGPFTLRPKESKRALVCYRAMVDASLLGIPGGYLNDSRDTKNAQGGCFRLRRCHAYYADDPPSGGCCCPLIPGQALWG